MRRFSRRDWWHLALGFVFCSLLALIVTVAVVYAVAFLWNLVAPLFRG